MAKLLDSRFLVGSPKADLGCWYIFFGPHMIREIEVGEVRFGLRARLAIKLGYKAEEGKVGPVYLSFDDPIHMQQVLEDLRRDANLEIGN